jgi:hypothetical protein
VNELLALKNLALNRTSFARTSLFEKVAGLWLKGAADVAPETQLVMDDILVNLVSDVERDVRIRIAQGLASRGCVPNALVAELAADPDICIAGPLLEKCAALDDAMLVRIAENGGSVHRCAIGRREIVSQIVSRAVCAKRELEVVKILIGNAGAQLDRHLFNEILSIAKDDQDLRGGLLQRKDLPADFAYKMFWWVTAVMRHEILERYPLDPKHLDAVLSDIMADMNANTSIVMQKAPARPAETCNVKELISKLNENDMRGFVRGLGGLLGISPEIAGKVVADSGGEALAIAAKAFNADRSQFTTIFLQLDFKRFGKARPMSHVQRISNIYDSVTQDRARAIISVWNAQAALAA